jgi:heme exporter protein B
MLAAIRAIAAKDIRLIIFGGAGMAQTLLLGLLLIFVFSLSREPGSAVNAQTAVTIFWLASTFCLVLAGNMCHGLEDAHGTRAGLMLIPAPLQSIWLGKMIAILFILLIAQCIFLPATIIFLDQSISGATPGLLSILLIDIGLAAVGSLLGALAQGQMARESLLSVVLFPLIIPVLLAGIKIGVSILDPGATEETTNWFSVIMAFTGLFLSMGLVLFPFAYTGEE